MEIIKRARSGNWSQEEKETLLSLIRERIEVIENKTCDGRMIVRKQKMWMEVKSLFDAQHGGDRELQRLKEQWRRMKSSSKESVNMLKKYQRGTGGGGAFPENGKINPPTEMDYQIMTIIPDQFRKDSCSYDDDAELEILQEEELDTTSVIVVQEAEPEIVVQESTICSKSSKNELVEGEFRGDKETPQRSAKRKCKEMSAYEEAMFELQKQKIGEQTEQVKRRREMEEELHKEELELKKMQMEIRNAELKIKKEDLEIKRLEKLFWQRKLENGNI